MTTSASTLRVARERRWGVRVVFAALMILPALGGVQAQGRANMPATCQRDLFQNEAAMRRQQTRMDAASKADQAEQCRAWRDHVAFMQNARSVFATCQTGRLREENVGQMDASLAEYRVLLANRCGKR